MVDASTSLAWSLDDERDDEAIRILEHVELHGALAPILWTYEIANALSVLIRRKRIDAARAISINVALDALPIVMVKPETSNWRNTTIELAREHALTVYDASYLALAIAADARVATLDRALQAAARSRGIAFEPSH